MALWHLAAQHLSMQTLQRFVIVMAVGLGLLACDGGSGARDAGGGDTGVAPDALVPICRNACETLESEVCIAQSLSECQDSCPSLSADVVSSGCTTQYASYSGCLFGASSDQICPEMSIANGSCGAAFQAFIECMER